MINRFNSIGSIDAMIGSFVPVTWEGEMGDKVGETAGGPNVNSDGAVTGRQNGSTRKMWDGVEHDSEWQNQNCTTNVNTALCFGKLRNKRKEIV
jgi:hypothetical protein